VQTATVPEPSSFSAGQQRQLAIPVLHIHVTGTMTGRPLLAWIVLQDETTYPGQFVARLLTDAPTPYVLLADTLGGLQGVS
jgi:hypothetical protein